MEGNRREGKGRAEEGREGHRRERKGREVQLERAEVGTEWKAAEWMRG